MSTSIKTGCSLWQITQDCLPFKARIHYSSILFIHHFCCCPIYSNVMFIFGIIWHLSDRIRTVFATAFEEGSTWQTISQAATTFFTTPFTTTFYQLDDSLRSRTRQAPHRNVRSFMYTPAMIFNGWCFLGVRFMAHSHEVGMNEIRKQKCASCRQHLTTMFVIRGCHGDQCIKLILSFQMNNSTNSGSSILKTTLLIDEISNPIIN